MKRPDIDTLFAVMQRAYPGRFDPDELTADLWAEMLSDVPADEVMASAKLAIATNEWPPTIATIRKIVEDRGGGGVTADRIVSEVMASLADTGEEDDPSLSPPASQVVCDLGRRGLYYLTASNRSAVEAKVRRSADALLAQQANDTRSKALLGRGYTKALEGGESA